MPPLLPLEVTATLVRQNPDPHIPVAHRLMRAYPAWSRLISDPWTLSIVRQGYRIPLLSSPPLLARPPFDKLPGAADKAETVLREVEELLNKGAITRLKGAHSPGFYSHIFLVRKSSGGWRPVLDLSRLNLYVENKAFRMDTPATVLASVHRGDWLASIDLTDAYLHVPIHADSQHLLRFTIQDRAYQFAVLPFGLCSAPYVFTKVLRQVVQVLHQSSVHLNPYLDDWLLRNTKETTLSQHIVMTQRTLQDLGFLVNHGKSQLSPSRDLVFLGMQLDTLVGLVRPSLRRCQSIMTTALRVGATRHTSVRKLMRLIGMMTSVRRIVPHAALRSRPVQRCLLDSRGPHGDLDRLIPIGQSARTALLWWSQLHHLRKGVLIDQVAPTLTLVTDACLTGWGGHLMDLQVQGVWSPLDRTHHINWLELKAVVLSLQVFRSRVRTHRVLLRTDNSSVVAYINKEGGTRSPELSRLVEELLIWCLENEVELIAYHLPGIRNSAADALSRQLRFQNTEWQLAQWVADALFRHWDGPKVDLFATHGNARLPIFVSLRPEPLALATDALAISWSHMDAYAFPPFPLIQLTLEKVRVDSSMVLTLVAPRWPAKAWFPLLLSLLIDQPIVLPDIPDLLSQVDGTVPMSPALYHLHAWRLSSDRLKRNNFLSVCPKICQTQSDSPLLPCMSHDGDSTVVGVTDGALIMSVPL